MIRWIENNKTDIICCGISVIVYGLSRRFLISNCKGVIGYFMQCYLNDLMAPVFVLALSSIILKWAGYELHRFWTIILIGAFAGFVWEFVIPLIKPSSVTDPYDLVCYLSGTIVYYGVKTITSDSDHFGNLKKE